MQRTKKETAGEVEQLRKAAKEKLARLIKECFKGKDINRIIEEKK